MKRIISLLLSTGLTLILGACGSSSQDHKHEQKVTFPIGSTLEEKLQMASNLVPTPQQVEWQEHELTAFLHFGMNTFTGREWGDGTEDPALFNPTALDADQWVCTLKEAGFKLVILTAKHHDGFCLWPTKTTAHSVASSPWKGGKGDVVAELAEACHKHDMRLGIYLSPWDRNHPAYGTGDGYNKVYVEQLTELLTNYGRVDEVWFDGANGEGPNGKKQIYDWSRVAETIARLQPDAVTAIMGKDVRWVGNERGYGRETEWSATVLPPGVFPQSDSIRTALNISETVADLGSQQWIEQAGEMYWWPSEVDVSIRPGWFYHPEEDGAVKSVKELTHIYFSSVGMNSGLLLNVPPNKDGRLSDADVQRIREFGAFVKEYNRLDAVVAGQSLKLSKRKAVELSVDPQQPFSSVLLQEDIRQGQRVENFEVDVMMSGAKDWEKVGEGTTIGYKRILLLDEPIYAQKIRVRILDARGEVHLRSVKAHLVPTIDDELGVNNLKLLDPKGWNIYATEPLTVDIGKKAELKGFVYAMKSDRTADTLPTHFVLEVSENGTDWTKQMEGEFGNIINNPIPQVHYFESPLQTRYIRLGGTSISGTIVVVDKEELKLF